MQLSVKRWQNVFILLLIAQHLRLSRLAIYMLHNAIIMSSKSFFYYFRTNVHVQVVLVSTNVSPCRNSLVFSYDIVRTDVEVSPVRYYLLAARKEEQSFSGEYLYPT